MPPTPDDPRLGEAALRLGDLGSHPIARQANHALDPIGRFRPRPLEDHHVAAFRQVAEQAAVAPLAADIEKQVVVDGDAPR